MFPCCAIFSHVLTKCLSVFLVLQTYSKPCETLTRHIQNPVIGNYSAIFRHIQNLVQCLHTQKSGILKSMEYSEPFLNCTPKDIENAALFSNIYMNIQNSDIFKTRHIFRTLKIRIFFPKPSILDLWPSFGYIFISINID